MAAALIPQHWYYNTESGQLTQGNNLENLANNLFGGLGWHELNISGTATAAQAAAEARKEFPAGKAPTTQGIAAGVGQAAQQGVASAAGAIGGAIASSFSLSANTSFLARLAEGVLGVILIAIGLARVTRAIPIATKIAGAVA